MFGLPEEKKRKRKPDESRRRRWKSDAERKARERRLGRDLKPPPIADPAGALDAEPTLSTPTK